MTPSPSSTARAVGNKDHNELRIEEIPPAMKTVEIAEATSPPADYVPGVRTEPLVITEHGTPTAVMLPLNDVDPRARSR